MSFALLLWLGAQAPALEASPPTAPAPAAPTLQAAAPGTPALEAPVGLTARVGDVVLAGSELEVAPLERTTSVVVRITRVAPHGDAFRYDFELVGLDPGTYDVAQFLRRKDASAVGELAAPRFTVLPSLEPGRVLPHAPTAGAAVHFGGYTTLLWSASVVWVAGLAALLFAGRRRRAHAAAAVRPKTLAERLEPLVQRALRGELGRAERASLELGLVAYWSRRLGWEQERPDHVLPRLRAHPEAGPLLVGLEQWLHAPGQSQVDVNALLAPYRSLPEDALSLEPAEANRG